MEKRKSHRQRDALRDLVERTGISRREAGRILKGEQTSSELDATELFWLGAPELPRLIEEKISAAGVDMDTFTPAFLVEGHIEEKLMTNLRVRKVEIEDAYLDDPVHRDVVGVDLIADGTATVDWHVTQPTYGDVFAHGPEMEGVDDGPGMWQDCEDLVPVQVRLHAQYRTTTVSWSVQEIRSADIDEAEAQRRARDRDAEDTRRQQALGLLPSDDEIQEMADQAERERLEQLTEAVERLLEDIDGNVLRDDFLSGGLQSSLTTTCEPDPEQPSTGRPVVMARIAVTAAGGGSGSALDTLRAWVEQDSEKTQVILVRWTAIQANSEGPPPQRVEAVFAARPYRWDTRRRD